MGLKLFQNYINETYPQKKNQATHPHTRGLRVMGDDAPFQGQVLQVSPHSSLQRDLHLALKQKGALALEGISWLLEAGGGVSWPAGSEGRGTQHPQERGLEKDMTPASPSDPVPRRERKPLVLRTEPEAAEHEDFQRTAKRSSRTHP